jgi:hypothetical protein
MNRSDFAPDTRPAANSAANPSICNDDARRLRRVHGLVALILTAVAFVAVGQVVLAVLG